MIGYQAWTHTDMSSEFETIKRRSRETLRDFPEIRLAILFGSAAGNRLRPDSDVDIGVAADEPLSLNDTLDLQAALSHATRREVDLVDMQAVSGLILQQILTTGAMLQKDVETYAALMKRMLLEQADMLPYTQRVTRTHVERYLHG